MYTCTTVKYSVEEDIFVLIVELFVRCCCEIELRGMAGAYSLFVFPRVLRPTVRPDMRPDSTRTARVHGTRLAFARRAPHLRKPSPLWCAIYQQLLCSSQARRQGAHARRLDDDSLEAAPVADAQLLEQGQCVERTARARQASDVDTDELRANGTKALPPAASGLERRV